MIISKLCPMTREYNSYEIPVTPELYDKWRFGNTPIQDILLDLNEYQREFLISGMSYEAQDIYFKDPESLDLNEDDY
jgi:hypothetical protein